ncbi:MAG: Kelch repeat-containing protein [Actinomycetota bacterium]
MWRSLTPVPTARTEVAAAAVGSQIFVAGGFGEGGGTVAVVEVYDTEADRWATGPELPLATNHAMAASDGKSLFVLGGYAGPGLESPTDRGFRFDPAGDCPPGEICGSWEPLPRMPEVRAAAGAAFADGRIFVASGVGPSGLARSTLVFDPSSARWSEAPGLPTAREHLGVAAFDGRVFVVGGRTGGIGSNLTAAEVFDPSSGEWSSLPDMPTARGGIAAGSTENGFIVGAGGEAEATFDEAEALDVEDERWISLPPMPTARHGLGVVGVGDVLYVLAGGPTPGLDFSTANEAIDLGPLR